MRVFAWLGRFSSQFPYLIILAWLALAVGLVLFAPSLAEVSKTGDVGMLPEDMDSMQAQSLLATEFGGNDNLRSGVIVLRRDGGLTDGDHAYAKEIIAWLRSDKAPRNISAVVNAFDSPNLQKTLVSADGSAMLIRVSFNTEPVTQSTTDAVGEIRRELKQPPVGLSANFTGSVAIYTDLKQVAAKSVDQTTPLTVILVIVILLIIYRSPVAPIVPLATIGVSFFISRSVVAILGQYTNVSSLTQQFLVAVLFGAGTDYCLFLISRFGEELGEGRSKNEAVERTIGRVGDAITSSAATVIIGLAFTLLAVFGLFSKSGPFIALGVGITLLAGLTLAPSMMAILGEAMFWPTHSVRHIERRGVWYSVAGTISRRPALVLLLSVAVLLPPTVGVTWMHKDIDYLNSLPADSDTVVGFRQLKQSFGEGEMLPTTILVRRDEDWSTSLAQVDQLAHELLKIRNAKSVRTATQPLGEPIPYADLSPLLADPTLAEMIPDPNLRQQAEAAVAGVKSYLSEGGKWLRLDLVMNEEPYSTAAIDSMARIREATRYALNDLGLSTAEFHLGGSMPTAADVRQATDRDTVVLTGAVLAGVFVILMFLLRSLVAPVYLILTILLSYLTTLGMTTIVFQNIAGKAGLAWAVPLFSFIMLVALGEDYNIFLMSRIKEEVAEKGRAAGVVRAVERTGRIITSCGIILAGTFGVMMISQMAEVKEIGFAICFGIVLDTFIVRSVMVPSLVTLIGRWSWWPRRMPETGAEVEGG